MATTPAKPKDDNGASNPQPETEQREDTRFEPTEDYVAMTSRKSDGTPDQTENFKVLDEDGSPRAPKKDD